MKCDVLKVYEDIDDYIGYDDTPPMMYEKSEVDAAIDELKDKCQMHDFFWEGCGFAKRGFKNTIAVSEAFDTLEAENESLLQQNRELCQALQVMYSKEEYDKQKYKRCLAMARWCAKNVDHLNSEGYIYEKQGCTDELDDCIKGTEFYHKWYNYWSKLAEKFKPNSTAQ